MNDFDNGFWVFGYGSLMWRPGFEYAERVHAELADHHRSFCLDSIRYRGTPERPGLVLALEPKKHATCKGVAFRVSAENAPEAYIYLREREMVTRSYHEKVLPLTLADSGETVEAICYVIDQQHDQYRCDLSTEEKAAIIAHAHGPAGPNPEYLFNTLEDLRAMQVKDPEIEHLAQLVRALLATEGAE